MYGTTTVLPDIFFSYLGSAYSTLPPPAGSSKLRHDILHTIQHVFKEKFVRLQKTKKPK